MKGDRQPTEDPRHRETVPLAGSGEGAVGDTIGPHHLLGVLGEGAMGTVHPAERSEAARRRDERAAGKASRAQETAHRAPGPGGGR